MAGIGFELRKILVKDTLFSALRAYSYAGIISSGSWILSIVGILLIGILGLPFVIPGTQVTQFQVSVTYLIASSLILTGPLQLALTRFTSDRMFDHRQEQVLSNYHAVALVTTAASGVIGLALAFFAFPEQSVAYRLLMIAAFVVVSNIWIAVILLSGMKQYKQIVFTFLIGYSATVGISLALAPWGLHGLILGFLLGQIILLTGLILPIYRVFISPTFMSFEMFQRRNLYPSLLFIGFFYNLGIWLDKFMFWYSDTGQQVIGPLHASVIYDIPIFLAYLGILPGMAVFLVRIETDFVEFHSKFYNAVREGSSLDHIERMRNMMVRAIRVGIYEIVKIQAIAIMLVFVMGGPILRFLNISELYLPLLYIDIIAASLQVVFLGILNIFFYLDHRQEVMWLTGGFVVLNGVLSYVTIHLGPAYYGYGFAIAMLVIVMAGLYLLDKKLGSLEYHTYMLQKSA
ncbi:hypothetical protein D3C72_199660 [compost metagenome]